MANLDAHYNECGLQLLDTTAVGVRREKMYKLDGHVACAVAGITGGSRGLAQSGALAEHSSACKYNIDSPAQLACS